MWKWETKASSQAGFCLGIDENMTSRIKKIRFLRFIYPFLWGKVVNCGGKYVILLAKSAKK